MAAQKLQVALLNFKEICRTCSSRGELLPLFNSNAHSEDGENAGESIKDMLMAITNVKAEENDCLPQNICKKCCNKLIQAYDFKQQCEKNDSKLQSLADSEFMPVVIESILPVPESGKNIKTETLEEEDDEENTEEYYDVVEDKENEDNNKYQTIEIINENDMEEGTIIQILSPDELTNQMLSEQLDPKNVIFMKQEDFDETEEVDDEEKMLRNFTQKRKYISYQCMCQYCGDVFNLKTDLIKHIREEHCDNEQAMQEANEIESELQNNDVIETEDGVAIATVVDEHQSAQATEEELRTLTCSKCNYSFNNVQQLRDHKIEHVLESRVEVSENGELIHICQICYRTFPSKHGLSIHQAFHTNRKLDVEIDKPYSCPLCEKTFVSLKAMRNHKKTHGTKTYMCNVCQKTFTIKARLQIHIRTHTGEKPYSCPDCGKRFGNTTSLRIHDLIHSGARPHYCKICARSFKQHSHLKNHLLTHSGVRPFQCPICGKTFVFKGNLTVHMRMHSGETPYTCPDCGKGFYDSSRMKKHRKTHDKVYQN